MSRLRNTSVFLLIVPTVYGWAQETVMDTAKALGAVEVSSPYARAFSTGNKIQLLDSALLNRYSGNNLGELLNTESDVYVKSYGLGTLATTSIRGGGSNHTALLWNGFNLQSPMYGPQDLSLITTNFFNEVMIQYGSAGATWGSGAVGGAVHLNNSASFDKGFSIAAGTSFGSFADKQQHASLAISKKRIVSTVKISNHTAKNNFPFRNVTLPEQSMQRLSNAELKQVGFMNENYFQINEQQKINVRFWYQSASRNIPPSMSQKSSVSNQGDESYRVTSEWQCTAEKLLLTARAGHFNEVLTYDDSISAIHSKNKSRVTILETEGKFRLTKMDMLTLALNNTYVEAFAEGYVKNPHQSRFSLIGSYKIHSKKNTLNGFLNVRQELIQPDNHAIDTIIFTPFKTKQVLTKASRPFTYSIGGEGYLFKYLSLNFSVAQHYRIPTFNDLYWAQGGNINLKPESGWGEEVGLSFKHQYNGLSATVNATVFNRVINNWILWTPIASGYWAPDNIMRVWSRGVEYRIILNYPVRKFTFSLNVMWNYTVSTSEHAKTSNDASLGKQLIYTPMYKGNGSLTISYKHFSITYNQKYVGYTYTSADNKSYLKPYFLSNVKVSQVIAISGFKLQIFAGINNAVDNSYTVIQNRPMPGRNYQIGCTFYFNKLNTNTLNKTQ